MKRLAALLFVAAALPASAADRADVRAAIVETFGRLSIAPQLCGLALDRARLVAKQSALIEGGEPAVEVFLVNNRIAGEQRGWTDSERTAFCAEAGRAAAVLGLL